MLQDTRAPVLPAVRKCMGEGRLWGACRRGGGSGMGSLFGLVVFLGLVLGLGKVGGVHGDETCLFDLLALAGDAQALETHALEMVLSSGKGLGDLGNYDLCTAAGEARYCLVHYDIQAVDAARGPVDGVQELLHLDKIGVCVPSGCDADDLKGLADPAILDRYLPKSVADAFRITDITCVDDDAPWTAASKVVGTVVAALAVLVCVGSCVGPRRAARGQEFGQLLALEDAESALVNPLLLPATPLGRRAAGGGASDEEDAGPGMLRDVGGDMYCELPGHGEGGAEGLHSEDSFFLDGDEDGGRGKPVLCQTNVEVPRGLARVLACFSLSRNWAVLTGSTKDEGADRQGEVKYVRGLRALSFVFIIIGQVVVYTSKQVDNAVYVDLHVSKTLLFQLNVFLAVETFLFLSGFLAARRMLCSGWARAGDLVGVARGWTGAVAGRWLRLVPAYAMAMALYVHVAGFMRHGYLGSVAVLDENCMDGGWVANFAFVANFVPPERRCMPWAAWYLSLDMQLLALLPIAVLVYTRLGRKAGIAFAGVLAAASSVACGVLMFRHGIAICLFQQAAQNGPDSADPGAGPQGGVDDKPWARASAYLMGAALAMLHEECGPSGFRRRGLMKLSGRLGNPGRLLASTTYWTVAGGMLVYPLLGTWSMYQVPIPAHIGPDSEFCAWGEREQVEFSAGSRFMWCLGLVMLLSPCLAGQGGALGRVLASGSWTFLCGASYAGYLCHAFIIEVLTYSGNRYMDYTLVSVVERIVFVAFLTLLAASALALLVEMPARNLTRLALERISKSRARSALDD